MTLKAYIREAGYGKKVVLHDVAVEAAEGEIVGVIGPNGAGKSTLLKVLMGLLKVPAGSVSLNGSEVTNRSSDEHVKAGISLVPQGNRVFTELSVRENLEMGGYLIKDGTERQKQREELLELFPDLKDRLGLDAGRLSGGEKQQLALARALMLNPRILMLDEPSLGLSPKLVAHAFDTICTINEKFRTTILLVEQKVKEALRISQKVYALRMGRVVFSGTPAEIQKGDTLRKIFLV